VAQIEFREWVECTPTIRVFCTERAVRRQSVRLRERKGSAGIATGARPGFFHSWQAGRQCSAVQSGCSSFSVHLVTGFPCPATPLVYALLWVLLRAPCVFFSPPPPNSSLGQALSEALLFFRFPTLRVSPGAFFGNQVVIGAMTVIGISDFAGTVAVVVVVTFYSLFSQSLDSAYL